MKLTEAEQNRLIIDHMEMVPPVVSEFRGGPIDFEELCAIGREGLVRAARTFNPRAGTKFSSWAITKINSAVLDALRAEPEAPSEEFQVWSDSVERIFDWDGWGQRGNAQAISELWTDLEASPEELWERYEGIKDQQARFDDAFISLSQRQRKLIKLVYLGGPNMTILQAAQELRISYFQAIRLLKKALITMREVFNRMDANEKKPAVEPA